MMKRDLMTCAVWCAGAALLTSGCVSSQWVYRATGGAVRSATPPAPASAAATEQPAIAVRVTVVGVPGEATADREALAQGLAQSLADGLQADGYAATVASEDSTGAAYALACDVQEAGVERFRHGGTSLAYRLAGDCTFARGESILWKDAVHQQYDEEIFFNTMTKLSVPYEARWVRECLLPWRRWIVWRTTHTLHLRQPAGGTTSTEAASSSVAPEAGAAGGSSK